MAVKIVLIIVSAILIVGGVYFYWYEYRPNEIRSFCAKWASSRASRYTQILLYNECLRTNGLSEEANWRPFVSGGKP